MTEDDYGTDLIKHLRDCATDLNGSGTDEQYDEWCGPKPPNWPNNEEQPISDDTKGEWACALNSAADLIAGMAFVPEKRDDGACGTCGCACWRVRLAGSRKSRTISSVVCVRCGREYRASTVQIVAPDTDWL